MRSSAECDPYHDPDEPLSFEHWMNALGTVLPLYGAYRAVQRNIAASADPKLPNPDVPVNAPVEDAGKTTGGSGSTGVDVNNLSEGWTKTENNGFTHVRDANGNIRVRIDPPDAVTNYPHQHVYDASGNSLDINGNIVSPKSPDAHIPLK